MFTSQLIDSTDSTAHEKMLTLPSIKTWLAQGLEWKPLNKETGHARAEMISQLKQETVGGGVLDAFFDARFVSQRSLFCKNINSLSHFISFRRNRQALLRC